MRRGRVFMRGSRRQRAGCRSSRSRRRSMGRRARGATGGRSPRRCGAAAARARARDGGAAARSRAGRGIQRGPVPSCGADAAESKRRTVLGAQDEKRRLRAALPSEDGVGGLAGEQDRNAPRAFPEASVRASARTGCPSGSSSCRVSGVDGAIRERRWSVAEVTCTRMSSASWPAAMRAAIWVASRAAAEPSVASRTRGGTCESVMAEGPMAAMWRRPAGAVRRGAWPRRRGRQAGRRRNAGWRRAPRGA